MFCFFLIALFMLLLAQPTVDWTFFWGMVASLYYALPLYMTPPPWEGLIGGGGGSQWGGPKIPRPRHLRMSEWGVDL